MEYKSKLRIALILQEKEIKEKEEQIAQLIKQKNKLIEQLKKEEEKWNVAKEELSKGQPIHSSFFMYEVDEELKQKNKVLIKEIENQLEVENKTYLILINKKNKMEELDKKREKEFYEELHKKELKKIESLYATIKKRKR